MICLSSCDKTPPAHLMAAGRFNIPTHSGDLRLPAERPLRRQACRHRGSFPGDDPGIAWKLTRETLKGMSENAIKGPGVCAGMATANSMHVGVRGARHGVARQRAGARQQPPDARPRAQLGRAHRRDGERRSQAAADSHGGRVSQCRRRGSRRKRLDQLHQAPAGHGRGGGGRRRRVPLFNDLGESVPVLWAVRPNGEDTIEEFEAAGGARALLKQLEPLLDTSVLTVTGQTWAKISRMWRWRIPKSSVPSGGSFPTRRPS